MGKALAMEKTVLLVLTFSLVSTGAVELGSHLNRTARQQACVENEEYTHNGFCCKNCEAGTFVKEKCTANREKGKCEMCQEGTYAEHPTGMEQCLQCSQCHADQIITQPCTRNRNTQCECKPGFFCLPEQPCEVCKKCIKCKSDEIEKQKCSATSNTKCIKSSPNSTQTPTNAPVPGDNYTNLIVSVVVVSFLIACTVVAVLIHQRRRLWRTQESPVAQSDEVKIPIDGVCAPSSEERENSRNAGLEEAVLPHQEYRPLLQETQGLGCKSTPVEDEDKGLGDSLPNTTNSSQTSLSALPFTIHPSTANCERETETWAKDDGTPRRLVPLQGEEASLKKSFDLFDVLDVCVHNKFFRSIGVSDNDIKLAESHHASDKVYELLRNWMQREGLRANINHLLQALLDLDQRYSAEQIASRAMERGYYKYE